MAKPFKKALTISTCILVAVALTIGAVAWFSGYKSLGTVGFQPGTKAVPPDLVVWTYNTANEEGADGWISANGEADKNGAYAVKMPGIESETHSDTIGDSNTTTTLYTYTLSSLHFGKVDNLVTLREDNKLLLRFYFDRDTLEDVEGVVHTFKLSLSFKTEGYTYAENETSVLDSFHLYEEHLDDAGNVIGSTEVPLKNEVANGGHVLEYREDLPAAMQFLQLRYAISTAAYTPSGEGFSTDDGKLVTLSESLPINCGSAGDPRADGTTPICQACQNGTCGAVDLTDELGQVLTNNTIPQNGGFYLYIELTPLLDAFGMQENILDYFVPAYMFFDIKLGMEIG